MAFLAAIPALAAAGTAAAGTSSLLAGIGGVVSAVGSVLGGVSAYNQGQYQAKVAEQEARQMEDNARRTQDRAQQEQIAQDRQTQALLGEQEARQGASGLLVTGGSQMLTRKATAELGRLDALNIRQGADVEAYNYNTAAASSRAQGKMAKAAGTTGLISGFINAGTSLLSSANKVKNPNRYERRA